MSISNALLCTLVTVIGFVQQGTQALCHRLVPLPPGGHVAQSVQQSLQH